MTNHVDTTRPDLDRDYGPPNEDMYASIFSAYYRDRARYNNSTGRWLLWNDRIWCPDLTQKVRDCARTLVRRLAEASRAPASSSCRKRAFVENVVALATTDQNSATVAGDWNPDLLLLGTPDGTVDLRTGELRAPNPADMITVAVAVAPAAKADCPLWRKFLNETFGGEPELIAFVQRFLGYSLTGDTREHALMFGVGGGGNGKSVLLNTVSGIMAGYACSAAMDTFTASQNDHHPTDLAMLQDARLVTVSETEEGRAWAESRLKSLTGGDDIKARFMRQDFFTYRPRFKLFIVGNHRPTLTNVDEALRRRFNIVPFDNKPLSPDLHLEDKLKAEWPGILRWMIDGALAWQSRGLAAPESIRALTNTYFTDQDVFGQWLAESCEVEPGNPYKTATSAELFASWKRFAEMANEKVGSHKSFADHLRRYGLTPKQGTGGRREWLGVLLIRNLTDRGQD
jgi:putative DNA primase/helicase